VNAIPSNAEAAPRYGGRCSPPMLAEVIRDLYMDERSGNLVLRRGGVEKRILLDRGMILTVLSTIGEERLLPFLVTLREIRAEEAEALRSLDDRQAVEVILKRGLMKPEAVAQANRDLAQQILTSMFRWEDLEYRFEEGPVAAGPLETNVIVSFELIIRAIRSMAGFEQIKDALFRQDRAVRFSDQLYLPFDQLRLTPIEGFLVSRVDGQARVRDILAQVPAGEEDPAARFLFGLLILGLANFVPPIGSGALSCADLVRGEEEKQRREERERQEVTDFYRIALQGNPQALLGLDDEATPDQVKMAYMERKERYQPSRFMKNVQAGLREELQIIEARLLEAFLALRSRRLGAARAAGVATEKVVSLDLESLSMRKELTKTEKQSMEEERSRMADQFMSKARDYFKTADFFNAIRYCEFAIGYNDKLPAAHSLLGQALVRNPDYRWQKKAENAFMKAAELEPFNPAHFIFLGDFYRDHELFGKARKEYEKALALVPNHPQALEAIGRIPKGK
jgi:tetratricopeptide (TPR) repeat protein